MSKPGSRFLIVDTQGLGVMHELTHWHPVLRSRDVRQKPVAVKLCDREIVVFRSSSGELGALEDVCCHRGMRLSKGKIDCDGCLVCPYHGWRYTIDGRLETSSTPKLTHHTEYFATCEQYGLIWLKSADSPAAFPSLDFSGFRYVATLVQDVQAPLEVALDNFTEVEHTGTAHAYFGYSQEQTGEIQTDMSVTPTTTAVVNKGIQRRLPLWLRPFTEVRSGDWFFNTWVTHFSPVYTLYDQYWLSPDGKTARDLRLKIAIFFNPIDCDRTRTITLIYGRSWWPGVFFQFGARYFIWALTAYELELDRKVVEGLADKSPSLRGKKLGRFDQPLIQNRKRIDTIYRGLIAPAA